MKGALPLVFIIFTRKWLQINAVGFHVDENEN